jgi:beta-lactamase regulating signal transducer with metallopeptidase domain
VTVTALVDVTVRAVAAALLHSLWQGALIALVTGLLWWALRGSRPNARYVLGCVALALMVSAWALTAWRTAVQLLPAAAVAGQTAPPALGPAGPFDASPAIRTISRAELDEGEVSWARRLDSWSLRLVPLWLVGVFGLSFRLALSWWVVQRLRRAAQTPVAAIVAERVQALAMALRVSRAVRVAQSAAVQVPAVIGWLRPVILLPASALTGLSAPQLDAILAHELAHIRRHDFAVNLLQTAAEILLFYHPACWWVSRRVRAERELCCDDVAVSLCGDRVLYASALAELESLRAAPSLPPALAATDGPLLQRVRRLLSPLPAGRRAPGLTAALVPAALLAVVMTGATITAAAAQGAPQPVTAARDGRLPAGHGIVRGQIVDAQSGRPVADAGYEITGTEDSASGRSDENGRFETRPLKAGTYTISARAKGYVWGTYGAKESPFGAPIDVREGRVSSGIEIRLAASGAINGRILDERGNGLRGVEIVLEPASAPLIGSRRPEAAFAQTTEGGVYRVAAAPGDYYVKAYVGEPLPGAKGEKSPTYVATFYPGVRVKEEGQPLRIDAGLDLHDIDFALATGTLVRVRGRVVDPSGDSLAGLRITPMNMSLSARGGRLESFPVDAEGRFDIAGLVPGQYMFNVLDQRKTSRWVGAMKHLTLDSDVDDLEMRATTGARVLGRIVRDPSSRGEIDFTEVRVQFEKRLGEGGLTMSGGPKVDPDGSFESESPGGQVTIGASFLPEGWSVKSIHLDRVDVDGQTVEMSGGTRQLQIVVTDRGSSLSGIVVDRNGRALPAYSVLLFPDDETRWGSSRFVMSAQSSQAGQFRLKDVPAGDYYAVALQGLPFRAWTNPNVLVRLQSVATKLKMNEGEQKTVSIRASPTPDNLPVP